MTRRTRPAKEVRHMAIILCPVCKGKCLCVVCEGQMEIFNEVKKDFMPSPVCNSQHKNVADNGVCQTCKGNLIGEPQAVHCGPWFCVSSMCCLPSGRSPEFPGKPPYVSRFHGVARDDRVLYGVALRTFEPAMLKAHGTRTNARKHHARRAARTARVLN